MPKRTDIHTILIIGSGPIVIGQAAEFDYSGTQACKVLRAEGYRVVLVNSNPATIMTDPEMADATYVEPLTPEVLTEIIKQEKPEALLPTVGGQTGLNLSMNLAELGVLERYGVTVAELESWNELTTDRIRVGQRLVVSPEPPAEEDHPEADGEPMRWPVAIKRPLTSRSTSFHQTSQSSLPSTSIGRRGLLTWTKG